MFTHGIHRLSQEKDTLTSPPHNDLTWADSFLVTAFQETSLVILTKQKGCDKRLNSPQFPKGSRCEFILIPRDRSLHSFENVQ